MPDITWTDEFFPILLGPDFLPVDIKTALDVGCGRGMFGCLLRVYREPEILVAVDVFRPYLSFVKNLGVYDSVLQVDVSKTALPFREKQFDVVLCLEVIEHLKKQDGIKLISELERVGERVIVSTPGFFYDQEQYDGNIHQLHLSCYSVKEFERRGYRVYGVGNLMLLGRQLPYASWALSKFTCRFPGLSSLILAVKSV